MPTCGPAVDHPEPWDAWWRACLADSDIVQVSAIQPGTWWVPIRGLSGSPHLDAALDGLLNGDDAEPPADPEEELLALPGGFVLCVGERRLLPQCCVDLSNIHDWIEAAGRQSETWSMLWIGHPWTHTRSLGDQLVLLEPTEEKEPREPQEWGRVPRQALRRAAENALDELRDFADVLYPLMKARFPNHDGRKIAALLVGL